jgi:hypothetical protein
MVQAWDKIRRRYAECAHLGPAFAGMLSLVEQIESSQCAELLYAWTSMFDLCIVQTPVVYPYNGPYLRISPLPDGRLEFRYLDTFIENRQWHRIVDSADGFARLESFIKQLHWVGNFRDADEDGAATRQV